MSQLSNTITSQGIPWNSSSITTTDTIYIDPNSLTNNGWYVGAPLNGTITIAPGGLNTGTYIYPSQSAMFIIDEGSQKDADIFGSRFNDIVSDEMHFLPMINGKNIEPLETVMKYIKSQKKIDIILTRIGYEIKIKGITFKSIRNLLSKDSDTTLKVVFEYNELIYDNKLLTLEEKRSIKIKELAKNIKKNDI